MPSLPDDYSQWRSQRRIDLTAPDGWLSIVGLVWLEPGANTVGCATGNAAVLPSGPERLGEVFVAGCSAEWRPAGASTQALQSDAGGAPSVIRCGSIEFFVIERDGRLALRIRDREAAARKRFAGIDCFVYDPAWRIEAVWDGECVRFDHAGQSHLLHPQDCRTPRLHCVFGDATNGRETYGGGRFLYADAPQKGPLVLDFNRAINPPCVFTPYATCPLPAPENRLPFPIMAGEKYPPA
ncbi:MAG: DUF1684 domain-containing protein [Rhodocyclaceae bacterium]|jgi:hypothetical protein|nr:DUF1684 domain-containing protein [Rhodocyclaceae bacterium]